MNRKTQILAGVFVLAVTAASAVAFTAYQRQAPVADQAAVQAVLGEAQSQSNQRSSTGLLGRIAAQFTTPATTGQAAPTAAPATPAASPAGAPGPVAQPADASTAAPTTGPVRIAVAPDAPAADAPTLSQGSSEAAPAAAPAAPAPLVGTPAVEAPAAPAQAAPARGGRVLVQSSGANPPPAVVRTTARPQRAFAWPSMCY